MFIWDPDGKDKDEIISPQGIPMPPGTDIEKKSIYHVIENPVWELAK